MLFIEYPKCSTCRKALKYLKDSNKEITVRNIVEETPTKEELIGKLQMVYVGDKNALNEMIDYYDELYDEFDNFFYKKL